MSRSADEKTEDRAPEISALARIDRVVARARLNLLWEIVWPLTAPLVVLAGLFAVVSWLGLWRLTSTPVRFSILALFTATAVYLLWRIGRFVFPTRAAAFARVEEATGTEHRPATSLNDTLATAPDDRIGQALWIAHRRRLLSALESLKAGTPHPHLPLRDPLAFRFLIALLAVVGFLVAGPERIERLAEAFRGGETAAATIARIDAWVTPPAYTGRAPIFLTGETARPSGWEYAVPTGSVVTVRTGGTHDLDVLRQDGESVEAIAPAEASRSGPAEAIPPLEHQATLDAAGRIVVTRGGREVSGWTFSIIPDLLPEIELAEIPRVAASGALRLVYTLKDDYGVIGARAEFAPPRDGGAAVDARPLYAAPAMPLSLPQLRTREGTGDTTRDLTSHPWAGATVEMTLVATDEAAQEGRSRSSEVTLPARGFHNPLARAVVEQRIKLALDANADLAVLSALDALTMAPEKTIDDFGNYLAVRTAFHRLADARNDDDLRGVVDYLWHIALGIEDGGLSLAAQALRDAQERLREALERDASDEEIAQLMEELREALQQFMQALMDEAMRNPQAALPPDMNMQMMRADDLARMLDQIEELARTGARDAARQMLSQLQNMLENLQAGQPQMGDPQAGQMMESLNELGDMIRRQEELMNQTHRAERGEGLDGEPLSPEEMQQLLEQLREGQQALADRLQELMEQMEGMGMEPNGKLGQAGEAMGRAGEELGAGAPGNAVGEQGTALDALRQGAQGLAQQLANQQGQGRGMGPGFRNGDMSYPNEDPLGRPQRSTGPDFGSTVRVPDEIDTQRAREILDAIRRRLGETFRPEFEREYLERLLDRF